MGVKKSSADVFVMMTQDAMPVDNKLIENLIEPLQGSTAVSYARQLPRKDSTPVESYTREFNYPERSRIKSAEDLKTLGIKTFSALMCVRHIAGRFMRNWADLSDIPYLMKT